MFYTFPLGEKKHTCLPNGPVVFKLKTQTVMFSKMALEEMWARVAEREDGRSVGPRPEERREIREITVKEQFVLWSPFQTPAPIRWVWADGGNSRDYTRLTLIPLLWSSASSEQKTTARLKTDRQTEVESPHFEQHFTSVNDGFYCYSTQMLH